MTPKIKPHKDSNFIKGFFRYSMISHILEANDWEDLEKKIEPYKKIKPEISTELFNDFKLQNCTLAVEYAITDTLNRFLLNNSKIKDQDKIKERMRKKITRNQRVKDKIEASNILTEETDNDIEHILTPHTMLYVAGLGLGELVDFINEFTSSFPKKKELVKKMTAFNRCRVLLIHNRLTSRENVAEEIEKGVEMGKGIMNLIEDITSTKNKK